MTDPISNHHAATDTPIGDMPHNIAGAARELGLKPVRAWVPDETKKRRTAGAERVRRCRERAEQEGFKQLSITVPAELHPMLKTLAARTKAGEPLRVVLAELVPEAGIALPPPDDKHPIPSTSWLDTLPAWRRWLLRWLLPSGVAKLH